MEDLINKLEKWGILVYNILEDGSIEINQDVDWSSRNIKELPFDNIKIIRGSLNLENNKFVELKNFPDIEENLYLDNNRLNNLENIGIVRRSLFVNNNRLDSFKGLKYVGGRIEANFNFLTNLEYIPSDFNGVLLVNNNYLKELTFIVPFDKISFKNNKKITPEIIDKYIEPILDKDPTKIFEYSEIISEKLLKEFNFMHYYEKGYYKEFNKKSI